MKQLNDIFSSIEIKNPDIHPLFFHLDHAECFSSSRPFHIEDLYLPDTAVLIHVQTGQMTAFDQTLSDNQVIFVDTETRFSLSSETTGTTLNLILFHGILLSEYLTPEIASSGYCIIPNALPAFLSQISYIIHVFPPSAMERMDYETLSFLGHQYLTELMTGFHQMLQIPANQNSQPVPSYLLKVRRHFEEHYALSFVLDDVVEWYGISKYKFCHDFKQFYGTPPLQFLNELRIVHAKELLLSSNIPVHEVGSAVGIDNTNHFITLFKRFTGVTPLQFRKNHISVNTHQLSGNSPLTPDGSL